MLQAPEKKNWLKCISCPKQENSVVKSNSTEQTDGSINISCVRRYDWC